jgi:hypothetical protein
MQGAHGSRRDADKFDILDGIARRRTDVLNAELAEIAEKFHRRSLRASRRSRESLGFFV